MSEKKETKAQRVERFKREKNAWDCMDEIRSFARQGHASIPPEWFGAYFRSWGIYTQGDGHGVTGGSGGEGKATPYFMIRIRIPGGLLTSGQVRTIATLAERHGRGVADITVRQNLQLHWVTIEDLPEVLDELRTAGLTTIGSCGDVVRNITGCPLAGLDAHEICDTSPLIQELDRQLGGNSEFYNLPRKFKVSVTGCPSWCSYPEINDVGLTATVRRRGDTSETGFSLRVGGGLSTRPHLAVRLDAFVKWNQVLPVVRGIAEIFRESDVLRENRSQARLKFLFLEHGWTAESFLSELKRRTGLALDPAEPEDAPHDVHRDHIGVHPQKQQALSFAGISVPGGRITPLQLRTVADLADRFASGEIRATIQQNLILTGVDNHHVEETVRELEGAGLSTGGSPFSRGTVACTGSEFCKLALTETKGFSRSLETELEERIPGFSHEIKLHVTGCSNSCGQHWLADIGIEGKKTRAGNQMVDAYYFCVGGGTGRHQAIARPVGYRCAATDVPDAIERLVARFQTTRTSGENLQQFFGRHSNQEIRTWLAGGDSEAVPRDVPAGPPPHGIEG